MAMQLLDVLNFAALTSAIAALSVDVNDNNVILLFTVIIPVSLLFYFLTSFDRISWVFFTELFFILFMHFFRRGLQSASVMLLLSWASILVCLTGFLLLGFLLWWNNYFPHSNAFEWISDNAQLAATKCMILGLVNGVTIVFESYYFGGDMLGYVLIVLQGLVSFISCITRLVYRWREYDRVAATMTEVLV